MPETGHPSSSEIGPELESWFEISLDLLCIAGLDGYFKRVNPSWSRVLGWSHEELLSRPVHEFMHPDDRERTLRARAALATGRPIVGLENRYLCKDGTHRWLSWQASIRPGGDTVFAVARDITDRRSADEERLVLQKLQSASVLAGGIAHDFNNLLASLLLNLDMIGLAGPTSREQTRHLRQARETIDAARSLTSRIVAFSEADTPHRRPLDLAHVISRELDALPRDAAVRVETSIATNLHPAEADEIQIGQALRAVLANAIESLPRSGGRVRLSADNANASHVRVVIEDNGAGIAPEILPRIFDPYFSTKERGREKGMGLGLAISHAVLRRHGGSIEVDSEPGAGTRVTIYLPAERRQTTAPAAEPLPVANPAVAAAPEHEGPHRVLILEDEPALREVLGQMVISLGHEPACAAGGAEALALDAEARRAGRPFDTAFLDLGVRDGLGGLEIIRPLRATSPGIYAIVMSGHDSSEVLREPERHGFDAALAKPFPIDRLRDILGTAEPRPAKG